MKYKVGDKVRIRSLDWYNANKNSNGKVNTEILFVFPMSQYCGKEANIIDIIDDTYFLDIDKFFSWSEDMFDENFKDMETKDIIIPDGWEVDKIKDNKVILKKSKKELPKTWEECYTALKDGEYITNDCDICYYSTCSNADKDKRRIVPIGLGKPLLALCQLLVCREAYRNGWKPDWRENNDDKHCIKYQVGGFLYEDRLLSFQSAKVRDKFLKNFRDLIEEAKELI